MDSQNKLSPALVLVLIQKTASEYVGTMAIRLTGSEIFETSSAFCRFPGFPRPLFFYLVHALLLTMLQAINQTDCTLHNQSQELCFAQSSLKGGKLAGPRKRCSRQANGANLSFQGFGAAGSAHTRTLSFASQVLVC